jgi:hypothetical protein
MKIKTTFLTVAVLGCCSFWADLSYATTYYVRPDGGTSTQCTGTTDAAYSGAGSGQPCAFKHPFWAIAPIGNNPTKLAGGDTLIIDGSSGTPYMIGYGAPNTSDTSKCHSSYPWDCQMRTVPSGPDATHPTRILGKGWDTGCAKPPQLYGRERLTQVMNLTGSNNVELQCLEITDHSDCQDPGPKACNRSTSPFGDWADWGIVAADSSNVLIKNVNIHGMAHGGVNAGRIKDWTIDTTKIVGNSFVGWDGDIGATTSSNSGTISFNKVTIAYNGCGETYPGKAPYNCFSQSQSGYGDGLGTATTGGNWVFTNSNVSHNTSDGIDLLYHNGSGTITVSRVRAEGNAGNQVKVATNATISNSIIIGDCAYFKNNPVTWDSSTFDNCRAEGNAISLSFRPGMKVSLLDSTVMSNGDGLIISSGTNCNGTESLYSRNNIFLGRTDYTSGGTEMSSLYYASGATGNGDGPCANVKFDDDYSIIYTTKLGSSDVSGKAHSKYVDPKLTEPLTTYYTGSAYNVALQSASPAVNAGVVLTGASSLDYNSFSRASPWDIGALEYGSASSGGTTPPASTCGNGKLDTGEQCDGSLLNGKTCVTQGFTSGSLSCTSSCTLNTAACVKSTTTGGPAVCGDGLIESGEWCDGSNLNGQTCVSRGYKGGSLKCYACAFNTFYCWHCGNGMVESGNGEQCDGASSLSGKTCSSLGLGTGTLGCTSCKYSGCSGTSTSTGGTSTGTTGCGNGKIDAGEQCDGTNLGGKTCASYGYISGTLSCTSDCKVTLTKCTKCGNGVIDSGEWCDGNNLNGQTCKTRGFTGGTLRCYACAFNTYYCTK